MYYDLHIHSVLSPCSDDEMTVNNIVNMSLIKELDLIAITDHNSMKQLEVLKKVASGKINILLGTEIQSCDGIHILAYFHPDYDINKVQNYLDQYLIEKENNVEYYGEQLILNELDEVVDVEKRLLINSLNRSTKEVIDDIHKMGGKVILAHVYRKYGYIQKYGRLDFSLNFDGVEVVKENYDKILSEYPALKDKIILCNSDAHYLGMINEPELSMTQEQYLFLKGESHA